MRVPAVSWDERHEVPDARSSRSSFSEQIS